MPYIYQADVWCDSCGQVIRERLLSGATEEQADIWEDETAYDSDEFPKWMSDDEESDSPQHCAAGEECLECETLPSGTKIGALLGSLTSDGAEYVKQAVGDGGEVAEFWRDQFDWIDFPAPVPGPDFEVFLEAYVECALWSSTDELDEFGGRPMDDNYGPEDIAPEALASMREECLDFWNANPDVQEHPAQGGHDFWLTRNGHGAGFWDRGDLWPGDGKPLTDAAHVYGSSDLYIGDDGRIYVS